MGRWTNDRRRQITEHITALEKARQRTITPKALVQDAMNKSSPLHREFCWDKNKLAWDAWMDRARQILAMVEYERTVNNITVKCIAYVHDPRLPPQEQGYVHVSKAEQDAALAREILIQEFGRAKAALERAYAIANVLNMRKDVDKLIGGLAELQQRAVRRVTETQVKQRQ